MATFTDEDRLLLDQLRKAFEKASRTTGSRQPWQEIFKETKLTENLLEGLSGSWASLWSYGKGSTFFNDEQDFLDSGVPVSPRAKTSKIGQRGVPEINFVPYNYRTNQIGTKGASFVGHPISFEVVGPTLKSPATDWTWQVNLGMGPNGGDLLTMFSRPDGQIPTCQTIGEAYNIVDFTIGDASEPNGGLYLFISDDGDNPGSVGAGLSSMSALPDQVDTARYEIFRISNITGNTIEVHPNKSLSSYFDLPGGGDRYIRAITIIKPYVTRLAAIPGSGAGVGREQVFYLISPDRAASSDLYPPYDGGSAQDGTWLQGGFTTKASPGTAIATGVLASWLGRPRLPIPRPIKEGQGLVESDIGFISPTPVGEWTLFSDSLDTEDIGKVIHIINVRSSRYQENEPNDFAQGDPNSCLGWYEVLNVIPGAPNEILLLRLPEPNPSTGVIYYGPGPYLQESIGTEEATVSFTVHDNISSLWLGSYDVDRVESSRLNSIIDPREVERFQKSYSDITPGFPKLALGNTSGRPEKSIFNTRAFPTGISIPEAENPGSLMDLGFRMVLFPAKNLAGRVVPDYDKPITGREVVIDSNIEESQYLTIDYSAGSVTLSHPPPNSSDGDIIPNGIIVDPISNPREEVVLYAACVPFSMEKNQEKMGTRLVTKKSGDSRYLDCFSESVEAFIDLKETNYFVTAPYFGPSNIAPNPVEIVLDRVWRGPETGVIEVISGGQEDFPSFGTWGYSETRTVTTAAGDTVTALGGISSLPNVQDPSVNLSVSGERKILLRREVFFGERSSDLSGVLENYRTDTTYGSFLRSNVLRFNNAEQKRNIDGSNSIMINPPNQLWQQWGCWNAANIPTGAGLPLLAADGVWSSPVYFENSILISTGAGTLIDSPEGQTYRIEILPAAGNNRAVVTNDVALQTQQRWRIVTKFGVSGLGGSTDCLYYIGLMSANAAGAIPVAFSSPIDPNFFYIGIRMEGDVQNPLDLWSFVIQNPITATTRQETFSLEENKIYYFIMETEQDGRKVSSTGNVPTRLKVSILDQDLNSFFNLVILGGDPVLPNTDTIFNYFTGLEYVSGGGRRSIDLQMVSYVNRIDLPGPEFGL